MRNIFPQLTAPAPLKLQWNRPVSPYRPKRLYQKQKSRADQPNPRFGHQTTLWSQSRTGGGVADGLDAVSGGVVSGCLGSEVAKPDRRRGRLARRGERRRLSPANTMQFATTEAQSRHQSSRSSRSGCRLMALTGSTARRKGRPLTAPKQTLSSHPRYARSPDWRGFWQEGN